jgi:tetratricopeptide (TPR) repeat protein
LVLLVVLACYANSFHGAFVLDDHDAVVGNRSIRNLWPLWPVLAPPATAGVGGRPVANLTFALNHAVGGTEVWSYHALNVLIHLLAACTLLGIVRRTLLLPSMRARFGDDATWLAAAVALLWALHPLATSAVDYVSQRTELLMAFFYLQTLYAFIRAAECHLLNDTFRRARGWKIASVACCALGMASKEVMATAPVLVLLYDRTFVAGSFRRALRARPAYYGALAATWLVLAGLVLGTHLDARGVGFAGGISAAQYAVSETRALLVYLRLALWPAPLVFDYGWAFLAPREAWLFAVAVAVLLLAAGVAVWRRPVPGFAAAAWFLVFAPTSSVVPIVNQPIAESRAYLPLTAAIALLVVGGYALLARRTMLIAAAGIAVIFAGATIHRHTAYATAIALWQDTVEKVPDNARAQSNLASALLDAGQPAAALAPARAALRLRPRYAQAHVNLGKALGDLGRRDAAIAHYRAALALDARLPEAHGNLGTALLEQGAPAEAIPQFQAALRLDPDLRNVRNNLAVAWLQTGKIDNSIAEARAALHLDPDFADAHYNLANALAAKGEFAAAVAHYAAALRAAPNFPRAENNLGVALLRSGRAREARPHFAAALRLKPDYVEARHNLAMLPAQK